MLWARGNITLMILQKLEIISSMKVMRAKDSLYLHTTVDWQLSMIQRNGTTLTITYGIEGPCQMTETEKAKISTIG